MQETNTFHSGNHQKLILAGSIVLIIISFLTYRNSNRYQFSGNEKLGVYKLDKRTGRVSYIVSTTETPVSERSSGTQQKALFFTDQYNNEYFASTYNATQLVKDKSELGYELKQTRRFRLIDTSGKETLANVKNIEKLKAKITETGMSAIEQTPAIYNGEIVWEDVDYLSK